MKIISGTAKNINIDVPEGNEIRPTTVRARKSLLDSLGDLNDKVVVDLFAGSGIFGLEAASRGAGCIFFVEKNPKHCKLIQKNIKNIQKTGVSSEFSIIKADASKPKEFFLNLNKEIDYIFADPPYVEGDKVLDNLLFDEKFIEITKQALFIYETERLENLTLKPDFNRIWKIVSRQKTNKTIFYFFRQRVYNKS